MPNPTETIPGTGFLILPGTSKPLFYQSQRVPEFPEIKFPEFPEMSSRSSRNLVLGVLEFPEPIVRTGEPAGHIAGNADAGRVTSTNAIIDDNSSW